MAGFRFTVDLDITGRNVESALKKLVKALYGGKAHFETVQIHSETIRDNGMHLLGPGSIPKTDQWDTLIDDKAARLLGPKNVGKAERLRRELLKELRDVVERINKHEE